MSSFLQINRHPGNKEIETPLRTKIRTQEGPETSVSDCRFPGENLMVLADAPVFFNKNSLRATDSLFLRRIIPEPKITYQHPEDANQSIYKKRGAPPIS